MHLCFFFTLFVLAGQICAAQATFSSATISPPNNAESNPGLTHDPTSGKLDLPDAPTRQVDVAVEGPDASRATLADHSAVRTPNPIAPLYHKYIEPGQTAQPLTGLGRKLNFGVHQIISPYFLVSVFSAAGYEHAVNSAPNYGTDKGAFGQRLGAAVIRDSTQSIFTDGLMPALFHQDPRYYVMGRRHGILARGGYAVSRVFITRSDSGNAQANFSLFAGHAETAILQNAYYPSVNYGVSETVKGFAGSFAGVALSNGIREFLPDLLRLSHRD